MGRVLHFNYHRLKTGRLVMVRPRAAGKSLSVSKQLHLLDQMMQEMHQKKRDADALHTTFPQEHVMSDEKPNYPRGMNPVCKIIDYDGFLPQGFKQAPAQGLSEDDVATLRERGFNYVQGDGKQGTEPLTEDAARQLNIQAEAKPADGPAPDSAYFLGPIIQSPVKPSQVLATLRDRINKGYMPSATGRAQYNGKPEYVRGVNNWINETHENNHGSGYYAEPEPHPHDPERLWAFLCVGNVEIGCQLKSDGLYVRRADMPSAWEPFDRPVNLDWHRFKEVVDEYL